ncbi:MAG: ABC-ATPase UvrA, partial [Lachnospiraceae bacterium]|nr:ABC-ATPase UvrA [Lachnospiraceae bacterium]
MSEQKMLPKREVIKVRGANEHNLKNLNVDIPRNQLVVITGLSGSGKSSLAFDTIYAEGQRRYMESLSSYARQFLGVMEKPNVERIEGLSPAISIDQKSTNRNPRSTVGTVTEIYDYFRLLYARIGIIHCPECGRVIDRQTVDQIVDKIIALPEGTRIQILAPVVRGKKGMHEKVLDKAKRSGYVRAIIDGNMYELSEEINLDKNIKHNIDIVVDRLVIKEEIQKRLTDSVETAIDLTEGLVSVDVVGGETLSFSTNFACPDCEISIPEIEPRSFSFNNPFGACPACAGLGYKMEFCKELIIPDESKSLNEGAIAVPGFKSIGDTKSWMHAIFVAITEQYHFSMDTPFKDYPDRIKDIIWNGTGGEKFTISYVSQRGRGEYQVGFEGLMELCRMRYRETFSESAKAEYETFMTITPCTECGGMRLRKTSLGVT